MAEKKQKAQRLKTLDLHPWVTKSARTAAAAARQRYLPMVVPIVLAPLLERKRKGRKEKTE